MQEPARPKDETERLAALRRLAILDTPQEQRFNRITRTAARLFKVPMALISLVDDERQWFKSRYGLYVDQTPRAVSFCGHAILQDQPLVVEDALADERFMDNPLVTGAPNVRFYAGRVLCTSNGVRLGTLCILDREPRKLSEDDFLMMDDLANWAEREINLSMVAEEHLGRLSELLSHVQDAVIALGDEGRIESASPAAASMLGHESAKSLRGRQLISLIESENKLAYTRVVSVLSAQSGHASREVDLALIRPDGTKVPAKAMVSASTVQGRRVFGIVLSRE